MAIYKVHAPSTTSLSDEDDGDDRKQRHGFENDNRSLSVVPAQWTSKQRTSTFHPRESWSSQRLSPFNSLPPEILIHILKHLQSLRDLHSALLVSRSWCECSVELLWHKPAFNKVESLGRLVNLLLSQDQTFTYASFVRRLNFLSLASATSDNVLLALRNCDRLERLTLVNCEKLSGNALAACLPHFPNIVALDLSGVANTTDGAVVGLAAAAKRLQGINLSGCAEVTDAGVSALAQHCPLLRRVKLSGLEKLTDAPVSALAKACPLLLEIDLNQCALVTDVSIRDVWLFSTNMREMRLSQCTQLTDAAFPSPLRVSPSAREAPNPFPSSHNKIDDLPPLIISRTFEHLRMLDLTACAAVTDDAIEGIISHAPKIRNLVLSKCSNLTDKSVELICRLGRHLHYLHLGHAVNITDRSVRTLARSCTRLRYIDFANCTLLTDMSVFELSSLPKLRRIGLVRVNNLTDEAIYSLAERHATLERIHLSYCDQISVMAIHFLLQKLHKLTHLSLTGVPAFRQPDLQKFCRDPPPDFSPTQATAFCVYSGKGVSQLRSFLTELFDHITEMNGTDDTEYEDDEQDQDPEAYREDDTPEPEYEDGEENLTAQANSETHAMAMDIMVDDVRMSPALVNEDEMANAAARLNAQLLASQPPATGAWRPPPPTTYRSFADVLPIVESTRSPPASDVASNRSAGTNMSNGATFFRNYLDSTMPTRTNGSLTPDLNFAEIGHGRGVPPSASAVQYHMRRGQEFTPHIRPSMTSRESSASDYGRLGQTRMSNTPMWPYQEPPSPVVAPGFMTSHSQEPQPSHPHTTADGRGRGMKKSLINAAEHLFGRGSGSRHSHDDGHSAGPSNAGTTS